MNDVRSRGPAGLRRERVPEVLCIPHLLTLRLEMNAGEEKMATQTVCPLSSRLHAAAGSLWEVMSHIGTFLPAAPQPGG